MRNISIYRLWNERISLHLVLHICVGQYTIYSKISFFKDNNFRGYFIRYLVAERDFDEGELIFQENAMAVGPNPESTLQCLICSTKVSTKYVIDREVSKLVKS